ncbi:MAG: MoaD family protein [Candidatus Thorarchaeota archaeon]|nr:MoaD family protein [Candidatus Thorarchaeota archaeon]
MRVTIKSFGPVRRALGSNVVDVEVSLGATVADVIRRAVSDRGASAASIILNGNDISGNLIILLNRRDTDHLQGLLTPVHDGDEITILPHVQGG